jgi:hypothetical protein
MIEPTFTYRLVKTTYRNQIEYEDGPGSLQNIVSDSSSHIIRVWKNMGEDFGSWILEEGLPGLPRSESLGWVEYSYKLERRPTNSYEHWRLVGFLNPEAYDEYDE